MVVNECVEFVETDVSFERMIAWGVMRFINDDIDECSAGAFLVVSGGGEVHVSGDDVAGVDAELAEEVLGAASLVGGDEVVESVNVADGLLEVSEVSRSGVGFIAEHHAGPLPVTHGRGAGVGEEVDVDVITVEEECVEAGMSDGLLAFGGCGHAEVFDHLDAPGFGPSPVRRVVVGLSHGVSLRSCVLGRGVLFLASAESGAYSTKTLTFEWNNTEG